MAVSTEGMTSFSGKGDKKPWKAPVVQMIALEAALGAAMGSKCDRYGSLSKGTGCP